MGMQFRNLDARTRALMTDEILADAAEGKLYVSKRLRDGALPAYTAALKQAAGVHDDAWLAGQVRGSGLLSTEEMSHSKTGKTFAKKVPDNAAEMLSEGEFNRFYMRGLCLRAIQDGIERLVVYRAKPAMYPRPESTALEGTSVDPQALLNDLRTHVGVDTALGLPPGPNSGLSVRLP